MDQSQVDDLDTHLRACSIGSPTVPTTSTPPPASIHALPSQPEDDKVGDISKILTQLYVLQRVINSESMYAELLRQAWATYRAHGLPPAQFRTLVDAECGPQRRHLAEMMRGIEIRSKHPLLSKNQADIEERMREHEEQSGVLRQREEMLLSVLPEGEREGVKWEPTADQLRECTPTDENLALLMQSLEERKDERLRRRAVHVFSAHRGYP